MKKLYFIFENWLKKNIRRFFLLLFLIFIYVLLTKVPYINIFIANGDLFTFFVSVSTLFIFNLSVKATVFFGISILILGFLMSILGYAANADILGIILYVMIAYLLIISIVKK